MLFWSAEITYLEVALPDFFLPASRNLFVSDRLRVYLGQSKDKPDFTLLMVHLT